MAGSVFERASRPVLEAIVAGASTAEAARKHGVGVRTVERWIARGREEPDSIYAPFAVAVDACRAARALPAADVLAAMDEAELALIVSEKARAGNVQAMRLRWEQLRAEPIADPVPMTEEEKILAEMDELAARRRRRGGDG